MKVVILGAGGLARELQSYLRDVGIEARLWEEGGLSLDNFKGHEYYVAVGNPEIKMKLALLAQEAGLKPAKTFVHPRAYVGKNCKAAPGVVVAPGCVLTTNVEIGLHTFVNINSTIGHDTKIGSFCTVNPGSNISGNVLIGDKVLVGTNSSIREKTDVLSSSVIGMGAAVVRNVEPEDVVVGVPAKSWRRE